MKLLKTHKIHPLNVRPGDSIYLNYAYEEPEGKWNRKQLKVDDFDEEMTIDTVIAYRTESGECGLKAGRALILGEAE